jgi:hypothetical protein
MIQCERCHVWQHAKCVGVDKSSVPREYYCERCMPDHVIHKARRHVLAQVNVHMSAHTRNNLSKTAANRKPSKQEAPKGSKRSKGGSRRTRNEDDEESKREDDRQLKKLWAHFDRIEAHNKHTRGFEQVGPEVPAEKTKAEEAEEESSDEETDSDVDTKADTKEEEETAQLLLWAGMRATRGQLKEMGMAAPYAGRNVLDYRKKRVRKDKKEEEAQAARKNKPEVPKPFIGFAGLPPCPADLLKWPWSEALPVTPAYLGKKYFVQRQMQVEQQTATRAEGGERGLRAHLMPKNGDILLPFKVCLCMWCFVSGVRRSRLSG